MVTPKMTINRNTACDMLPRRRLSSSLRQCEWGNKCFVNFVFLEGEKGMRLHYGFDGAETPSAKGSLCVSQIPRGTAILFQWGDRKDRMAHDEMTSLPLPAVQSWVGSSQTLFLTGQRPSLARTKAGQLIPRGRTESTEFS